MREKVLTLARVDLVPRRRISVLLQFNLRKFEGNQVFNSERQEVREGVGVRNLVCRKGRAGCHPRSSGTEC